MCSITQSRPILCDPIDCSLPGSSVHGIIQERIPEWVAISYVRGSSQPRYEPKSPVLSGRFFTTAPHGKPLRKLSVSKIINFLARRSNQSILKEISPQYLLEGLMLNLQYFGHLIRRIDSFEKTRMLGKLDGRSRRRRWRIR